MVNELIEIGGKHRPVNFGRNAIIEFEKLTDCKFFSGKKDFFESAESYRALAYAGLKWGLYEPQKGTEPKPSFTLFQVGDWLQENPMVMVTVFEKFYSSLPKVAQEQKKSEVENPENLIGTGSIE